MAKKNNNFKSAFSKYATERLTDIGYGYPNLEDRIQVVPNTKSGGYDVILDGEKVPDKGNTKIYYDSIRNAQNEYKGPKESLVNPESGVLKSNNFNFADDWDNLIKLPNNSVVDPNAPYAGGQLPEVTVKPKPAVNNNISNTPASSRATKSTAIPSYIDRSLNLTSDNANIEKSIESEDYSNIISNLEDSEVNKNKLPIGDATSLLRFAPAVGSLYNLLDKDKAAQIKLQRQGTSQPLVPGRINQLALDAQLADQYHKTVGDIISTSGGSAGAARAGIQAAGLSGAKAKAKAFSDINLANIGNKMRADQFNIGTENQISAANVGITNQQRMINMQNKLAADAKKEADRNAFFNTLGNVGLEQFQGNIISGANSGYGTNIFGKSTYKG